LQTFSGQTKTISGELDSKRFAFVQATQAVMLEPEVLTLRKRRKASRKLQIDYRPLGMIFATGMIHSERYLAPALRKLKHPKPKQNHFRGPHKLTLAKLLRTRLED
jgi:hypothetical protein